MLPLAFPCPRRSSIVPSRKVLRFVSARARACHARATTPSHVRPVRIALFLHVCGGCVVRPCPSALACRRRVRGRPRRSVLSLAHLRSCGAYRRTRSVREKRGRGRGRSGGVVRRFSAVGKVTAECTGQTFREGVTALSTSGRPSAHWSHSSFRWREGFQVRCPVSRGHPSL
jgi:hypothetical protein